MLAARELHAQEPAPAAKPRYVGAKPASIAACEAGRWSLYLFHAKTFKRFAIPYRCRSWRHAGECAQHNSHRIYSRMQEPLRRVDPRHVLAVVLTLDATEVRRCAAETAPGVDARDVAYRSLWRRWQSLRQALHRLADRMGEQRCRWALTVEAHKRSGWPHAHLVWHWPWFARALAADDARHDCSRTHHEGEVCGVPGCLRDWLSARCEASGLGPRVWVEVARDPDVAASYIVKLAGETHAGAAVGEALKLSQVPIAAPAHFRRIRYSLRSPSRGLEAMLEPVWKNPDVRGVLCNQPAADVDAAIVRGDDLEHVVDDDGEVHVLPRVLARAGPAPDDWLERGIVPHLMQLFQRLYLPFYSQPLSR